MSPKTRRPFSIEYALLGFLRQSPLHGYQIHQQLGDPAGLGLVWRLKQSQLYALLAKLEEEDYIRPELHSQGNRPTRRVYQLTGRGQTAFLDWVNTPVPVARRIRQEFMAKLYFARQEGPETAIQLIRAQQDVCQDSIERQKDLLPDPPDSESQVWLICQYRIHHLQAILEWLKLCERTQIEEVLR